MSGEMETLGAASLGALTTTQKADLSGQACRNCGTTVTGRYCPHCGQLAASFHRPFWALIGETITDTFALDGRVARTLPLLFLRPGRLTYNYTLGQRARYVPPFRLFLLTSLLFYFTLFALVGNTSWVDDIKRNVSEKGQLASPNGGGSVAVQDIIQDDGTINREKAMEALTQEDIAGSDTDARFFNEAFDVADDPQKFISSVEKWAPRLSLLLVPITILTLSVLQFWRRRVYIYDHAIHALHLHSWLYLSITIIMLMGQILPNGIGWIIALFSIYVIVYLIRSLAVSTQASHILSVFRFVALLLVWLTSILTLLIVLVVVGAIEA